jgi:hypothetical protein
MGLGGVTSSAPDWVPSNTQSVETTTKAAPASAAAVAVVEVAVTYDFQAADRSRYRPAKSLRIAQWTTRSG